MAWLPLREDYCLPASTALACPLPTPNRILAIGRNYADHAKELGNAIPDEPVVFQKANSSIIGPGESVVLPTAIGQVDHEGELLVVIGTGGRDIALDAALGHVAGYSIINDVTARAKSKALQAKGYPWFLAKCRDTFGPIGPVVVAANSLIDQFPLTIDVTVNGEVRQHGTTDQMIHDVAALIHYLSTVTELMPGDCIATGTPSGVGPLVAGDSVTVTISGIGTLTNPVI
jgi:2-keto-4-pentenoate hydratase/2-oxohepta-3-ene-1,7-dioic acid hydratase in catechol pathway